MLANGEYRWCLTECFEATQALSVMVQSWFSGLGRLGVSVVLAHLSSPFPGPAGYRPPFEVKFGLPARA